jgi:regulatory protein YycI of two-component signal transduction system YycFG
MIIKFKFITKTNNNFNFNIHLNNFLYIIEQEEEQLGFFMQGKDKLFSYQQLCFFTSCDI